MTKTDINILVYLAHQGYINVTRGQLICMLYPEERPLYEKLHSLKLIKTKKTCIGDVYRISKRGWKALTKDERTSIVREYDNWVKKIRPTVKEPHWLKWVKK